MRFVVAVFRVAQRRPVLAGPHQPLHTPLAAWLAEQFINVRFAVGNANALDIGQFLRHVAGLSQPFDPAKTLLLLDRRRLTSFLFFRAVSSAGSCCVQSLAQHVPSGVPSAVNATKGCRNAPHRDEPSNDPAPTTCSCGRVKSSSDVSCTNNTSSCWAIRCRACSACGARIFSQVAFSLSKKRYAAVISLKPPQAAGMLAVGCSPQRRQQRGQPGIQSFVFQLGRLHFLDRPSASMSHSFDSLRPPVSFRLPRSIPYPARIAQTSPEICITTRATPWG